VPEPIATALIAHLVRTGALGSDDINAIGEALEADGEGEAAHEARCAFVEAVAQSDSDFRAERARSRFHVISSDGGNDTA
jgi:phage tail tape-measure protein